MKPDKSKRVVRSLSLASFFHDIGSDMVFSVWPLFVTQVLGANMAILGIIDGLGDAIVSLAGAAGGYISDKIRKRALFVWLGYVFGGVARVGYAIAPAWQWLIPFRLLDRSGKVRGAPRDAILSDASTSRNRGTHFGIVRTFDNAGAVLGTLIAIVSLNILGFRNLFLLAAIPSAVAILLIMLSIRDPQAAKKVFKGVRFKDFDANLRLLVILNAIFALGSFSYSFLLIFANKNGFGNVDIPVLYLLFTVVAALVSVPAGSLSDKFGRKSVLYVAYGCWAAVAVALIFFASTIGIIAAFVLYGLHKGFFEPVKTALVAELAPSGYIASSIGAADMVIGLMALPASWIAGLLWDTINPQAPFVLALIATAVACAMLPFVREHRASTAN